MNADDAIANIGFRRWYERQLFESHACLAICFLCMIVLAVFVQAALPASSASAQGSVANLLTALGVAAIGVWSWNHYRLVSARAGRYGHVAHCEHCGTYARFDIEGSGTGTRAGEPMLKVRCQQCRHRWAMPDA